jgi:hypothetical protein
MRYDAAAIFSQCRPFSADFSRFGRRFSPPLVSWPGPTPEVLMARARPSSPPDPLDRLVGEAPALHALRTQKRQGLTVFQASGEAGLQPLFWALMAEMYERVGQVTAGLNALDTALALARKPGSCNYEGELYRLKGELLLARAVEHHAEADACFRQALDVARRQ